MNGFKNPDIEKFSLSSAYARPFNSAYVEIDGESKTLLDSCRMIIGWPRKNIQDSTRGNTWNLTKETINVAWKKL